MVNLASRLGDIARTWGSYLEVAEGPDGFYIFLRHVSPSVFEPIADRMKQLNATVITTSKLNDQQRATWKIPRPGLEALLEGPAEIVRLPVEAEM